MSMNVLALPSGLCCRIMASNADLDALTQASSGPYRLRTWGNAAVFGNHFSPRLWGWCLGYGAFRLVMTFRFVTCSLRNRQSLMPLQQTAMVAAGQNDACKDDKGTPV